MSVKKLFTDGVIRQNPVLVQLLGMCSCMAITTSLFNGVGMGLSVMIILTCCNIVISILRKVIPSNIRIAVFVVVIAAFVTIVDLLLQAYIPALSKSLGVFIPLIVVNCIIIGRAESFASKNGVGVSALDGIFQGLGYTLVLIVMCIIREFLGKGTFGGGLIDAGEAGIRFVTDGSGSGLRIFPAQYGALLMVLPFGGFLTLGVLIAIVQAITNRKHNQEIRAGKLSVIAALDAAHEEEGETNE